MIDLLAAADLAHLNEHLCRAFGGKFTAPDEATEASLSALADQTATAGYPSLTDKAAGYFHALLTQPAFATANERTALLAARTIVLLNDGAFHKKLKVVSFEDKPIPSAGTGATAIWTNLVTETAAGQHTEAACREWFRRNVTPPKNRG